jgi:folate-binding protein YgfZ
VAYRYVVLESRAIVRVGGADARVFLQGLISQDIERVTADRAAYGAFLTPQGKYLHDFCIVQDGDDILLDCEAARADDLVTRLSRYRLRADVTLAVDTERVVAAIFGETPDGHAGASRALGSGIVFVDPRRTELGWRAILPRGNADAILADAGYRPGNTEDYEALRVALTVPDGSRDLEIDRTVLLEANFDTLNGIDWDKGCYLGQELTARTKYRGLVKRRLVTVTLDGPAPDPGTPVLLDGRDVGVLRTAAGGHALASLRLEAIESRASGALCASDRAIRLDQ